MNKAVFLDRDGVINHITKEHDYIKSWGEFRFYKNALAGLRLLARSEFLSVVLTNQRGISRGLMSENDLYNIHENIQKILGNDRIRAFYHCPHGYGDNCDCRKPKPGMFLRAAQDLHIDLTNSFMIDDAQEGIEAGAIAGCRTILVLTGRGKKQVQFVENWIHRPDYILRDLDRAIRFIHSQKTI
ncbi:MAG: HAD family hydrolase [bacterium]|nr:HAD family hydrolase [bacterium]